MRTSDSCKTETPQLIEIKFIEQVNTPTAPKTDWSQISSESGNTRREGNKLIRQGAG